MASSMTFQFLDVGMGDGTLIQLRPDGQDYDTLILVDFGEEKSQFKVPIQDALSYLRQTIADNSKARKSDFPYIDFLFITHSDADHHNRLTDLFAPVFPHYLGIEVRLGPVYYSGVETEYGTLVADLRGRSASVNDLQDCYHAGVAGTQVRPEIRFGDISAYVLSANYPSKTGKTNPKSIVLMFDLAGQKVILQGDAEAATERWILSNFGHIPGFLEVVGHKLGHHGSNAATCQEWVAALKPKAIFASGDFVWAHPYCGPICRVLAGKTLGSLADVWYCCGNRGSYYNNHHSVAVCMNLWYYVKTEPGEVLHKLPSWQTVDVQQGATFGVQWALTIAAGAKPHLSHTDAVIPADVLAIPKGWDCGNTVPRDSTDLPIITVDDRYFSSGTVPPITVA